MTKTGLGSRYPTLATKTKTSRGWGTQFWIDPGSVADRAATIKTVVEAGGLMWSLVH